jgi:hypothetical protein
VAYSGPLQGGLFNHSSVYVVQPQNIERIVLSISQGLVLAWKKIRLEYTKYFQSPEYKHGYDHSWGHCNLVVVW